MDGHMKAKYSNEHSKVEIVPVNLPGLRGAKQLYKMWTHPKHRGKGGATKLIKEVCADADKSGTLLLFFPEPYDTNGLSIDRLVRLYGHFGAKVIQAEPVILMARVPSGVEMDLSEVKHG